LIGFSKITLVGSGSDLGSSSLLQLTKRVKDNKKAAIK
jgi:hypothetical protein